VQRGFYRVAQVLGSPLSLSETLDALAQAASEALGASFAAVLRPGRSGLTLAGSYELPSPLAGVLREGLPEGAEVLESAARDGRVVAAPRVAEDDRFGGDYRTLARETGSVSLLAVPVAAPDAEESGLALIFFTEERSFSDDDLALAGHLSGAARGALGDVDRDDASALPDQELRLHPASAAGVDHRRPAQVRDPGDGAIELSREQPPVGPWCPMWP